MKSMLTVSEIRSGLGVSMATADRIDGLLSGRIDPAHFRSLEPSVNDILGTPHAAGDVLWAVGKLLGIEYPCVTAHVADIASGFTPELLFLDVADEDEVTVVFTTANQEFSLATARSLGIEEKEHAAQL